MSDVKKLSASAAGPQADQTDDAAVARRLELDALRSDLAAQYREELLALRRERSERSAGRATDGAEMGSFGQQGADDQAETQAFLAEAIEQATRRREHLSIIKTYLVDPNRFNILESDIPSSTTVEEFAERKQELELRISLLKTLLSLAEEEYAILRRGQVYAKAHHPDTPSQPTGFSDSPPAEGAPADPVRTGSAPVARA